MHIAVPLTALALQFVVNCTLTVLQTLPEYYYRHDMFAPQE
jgi:hypothetical protein